MRRRSLGVTLAAAALLTSGAASPEQPEPEQRITVRADPADATTAVLTAWQRTGGEWTKAYGPVRAHVGKNGVGQASESTSHTPAGVWPLTEAFGIAPAQTRLPYREVTTSDWWVSDVASPHYNTHFSCAPGTCPFDEAAGENLGKAGAVYANAVVIDYNRAPVVPGAGSAFFLHVTDGKPTAGCVAIPGADLAELLRWLDPARHPVIEISG
ncbi:L,D-transpeptidase family protein [Amycolatopsis sp. FBCC-B4732]|uniref:L,D-transpeptidase family protein n=1 Tax=Amycolatopsis sp. FBCC-B4732 TaxID=3079339 RepID=UPI001FF14D8F|nr:L,D-transpeptidase family protein [Amycolatopsis sp. FBCC-B4732]UOX89364.1 L,D-transpeptidase family protein [Amycolatopsis sp. FBCC-B4732]